MEIRKVSTQSFSSLEDHIRTENPHRPMTEMLALLRALRSTGDGVVWGLVFLDSLGLYDQDTCGSGMLAWITQQADTSLQLRLSLPCDGPAEENRSLTIRARAQEAATLIGSWITFRRAAMVSPEELPWRHWPFWERAEQDWLSRPDWEGVDCLEASSSQKKLLCCWATLYPWLLTARGCGCGTEISQLIRWSSGLGTALDKGTPSTFASPEACSLEFTCPGQAIRNQFRMFSLGGFSFRDLHKWLRSEFESDLSSMLMNLSANRKKRFEEELALLKRKVFLDLFGNPFRPSRIDPIWLKWQGGLIAELVTGIEQTGRFTDFPLLGDCLEDLGCQDEAILAHCRVPPQEHMPECWLLELLLAARDASA